MATVEIDLTILYSVIGTLVVAVSFVFKWFLAFGFVEKELPTEWIPTVV
jgi:hypothetical protein